MKSQTSRARWIVAGFFLAIHAGWALLAASLIWNQGDQMIGFHPAILLIFPGVIAGVFAAIILQFWRQWQIGAALGLGALMLWLVVGNGQRIEKYAWRRAIALNSRPNEMAMAAIPVERPGNPQSAATLDIWEEKNLTPLTGFRWFGESRRSAPHGVYYGFSFGGIRHARLQKIRHGWRGVALVPRGPDLTELSAVNAMTYTRVGNGDWCVWSKG